MAEKIITPEFRGAWVSVFRATAQKQEDGSQGKPKFQIRAVFPPSTDMGLMKDEAAKAAQEKWGANIPKTLRSPFRLNDELDNPIPGIGGDWVVMTFSANEDRRPGVVDANLQDIIDETECYSGAWYRAQVRAYGYEAKGNKGVAFGLENVQKLRDGEALGGGRIPAAKAFTAVGGASKPSTANGLFD